MSNEAFDAEAKEAVLRAESEEWDTTSPVDAEPGDIPVIDVSAYLASGASADLDEVAGQLRHACETVGFWQLVGHGLAATKISEMFDAVRNFHALPLEVKEQIRMDRDGWPLGGVGYLPVGNRKLPARSAGNENEAFIMKSDRGITSGDNQWLTEDAAPGFRSATEHFGQQLEDLARSLLPIYATALGVPADHFDPGFHNPFWRLRMTHYPASFSALPAEIRGTGSEAREATTSTSADLGSEATLGEAATGERSSRSDLESEVGISTGSVENKPGSEAREATTSTSADLGRKSQEKYGIHPHVDTTFFTLLLQDSPGLTIYHTPKDRWINVPLVEDAFVVNSGELLRQWTNDRFLSVRHFAKVDGAASRYSIPFFFNATRDYPMECIPTCCSPENPAKYPTISYNESQGVIQGE